MSEEDKKYWIVKDHFFSDSDEAVGVASSMPMDASSVMLALLAMMNRFMLAEQITKAEYETYLEFSFDDLGHITVQPIIEI